MFHQEENEGEQTPKTKKIIQVKKRPKHLLE